MFRFIFIFFIFLTTLVAGDKIEIYATSMESKDSIVYAKDGVSVVYKDYYLTADSAIYNRKTGDLELIGNVRVSSQNKYKILGDKAKLNLAKKERVFKPFFMLENESEIWISADEGCGKNQDLDIKSGIISGCDPIDPLWKIEFSSSSYNTDSKWLQLYSARMYLYDIPIFYTPYFAYSLDRTRRTGLLMPTFGISGDEGFYYKQPIYIAESTWWDLELDPQIRTTRGLGLYSNFRFVNSKTSRGSILVGYFKEDQDYFLKSNIANQEHYGFNIKYDNSDFINDLFSTKLDGQSLIYADIKNMNDIDYINLSSNDQTNQSTSTQILSRVNLFYNNNDDYYGFYFKYYKNLTSSSNENTLQKLPTMHYHHYIDTFFKDHFLYNVNIKSNNIRRDINKKVLQTDFDIPVTFQTSAIDEYLNLSYTAYFYAQQSTFTGSEVIPTGKYQNGIYAREYNIFEASTNLSKAYKKYLHSISFTTRYTISGIDGESGYYNENKDFCKDSENKDNPRCEFYNISAVDESLQLEFTQYLFDDSSSQILYHRLSQTINNEKSEIGELENELSYKINDNFNFYNNMFFNYDTKKLSKIYHKLTYSDDDVKISLSHLYKDKLVEDGSTTSYLTSSASYKYDSHYSYSTKFNYDLNTNLKKSVEIGFLYQKRCWDFGMRYVENNRPILTSNNEISSIYDRYIYFTIVFKPFMTSSRSSVYSLKLPDTLGED